jgi:hypothetical protein
MSKAFLDGSKRAGRSKKRNGGAKLLGSGEGRVRACSAQVGNGIGNPTVRDRRATRTTVTANPCGVVVRALGFEPDNRTY